MTNPSEPSYGKELALVRRGSDWHLLYGEIDVSSRAKGPTLFERFVEAHEATYGAVSDALRSEVFAMLCLEEVG